MLPMLCDNGESKLAYDLLMQPNCPGWMYQIDRGATTTWERWDALREDDTVNETKMSDDFLGVQNYTRSLIGADGIQPNPEGAELTQMGYEFYPQALPNVLRRISRDWKGTIYVTENGISIGDDARRVAFIEAATDGVVKCMGDGLPIKGYFYWSLMDNFEWQKGYSMTFGLIAVDRSTQKRTPKESLWILGKMN